jgi:hypothetical protein
MKKVLQSSTMIFCFCLITLSGHSQSYNYILTLGIQMTGAITEDGVRFDPEKHDVYVAGSMNWWETPGLDTAFRMQPSYYDHQLYMISLPVYFWEYYYKYYLVEKDGSGVFSEWEGSPFRRIEINENTSVFDYFGYYELYKIIRPGEDEVYIVGTDDYIIAEVESRSTRPAFLFLNIKTNDQGLFSLGRFYNNSKGSSLHQFTIPSTFPSGEYYFYLEYLTYEPFLWGSQIGNTFTIINNNPGIEIIYPIEEESKWIERSFLITQWNSYQVEEVNLHYSLDNGITWTLIAEDIESKNGYSEYGHNSYHWEIPRNLDETKTHSRIRIEDASNPSVYAISGPFILWRNSEEAVYVYKSGNPAFRIFPNPSNERITISMGDVIDELLITDVTGKIMLQQTVRNTEVQVNLSNWDTGMYLVHIITNGKRMARKLVLQ